ncbi:MAG: HAMP domain-containing protein [Planctomycetes bacterium]|nr:HAMP domain-containing protein [Planctomycetota bacterium]
MKNRSTSALNVRHSHATAGLSLAMKLVLALVPAAAVPLFVLDLALYRSAKRTLYQGVDDCGIQLARTLALPGVAWWDAAHGTLKEAVERVAAAAPDYSVYLKLKYGLDFAAEEEGATAAHGSERIPRIEDPETRERMRAQEAAFRANFEKTRNHNEQRLRALIAFEPMGRSLPTEIVDAYIVEESSLRCVIQANPQAGAFSLRSEPRQHALLKNGESLESGAEIADGAFSSGAEARSFSWPIRDRQGAVTHRARVFLSTARVENGLRGLWRQIVWGTGAVLALLAVTAYVTGRWLARPILLLVDDVDIIRSGDRAHRTRVHASDEIGILARTVEALARREAPARAR